MRKRFKNKQITSLLLIICMIFSMLPSFNQPVRAEEIPPLITVSISTDTDHSITSSVSGSSISVAINSVTPSAITCIEVTGGQVTAEDWNYIQLNKGSFTALNEFKVDDTVTSVADIPSAELENPIFPLSLQTVDIAKVINIGEGAFNSCTNLTTATFLKAQTIEKQAFEGCTILSSATFPVVTSIGDRAFNNCVSLTAIDLPAVPPTVFDGHIFDGGASARNLVLVDANNEKLLNSDLTTAQNAYKLASDGNTADNLWYQWKFVSTIPLNSVAITGIEQAGQTLTATVEPSGATVNYQWKAELNNVSTIIGTNSPTYEVQNLACDQTITVTATGTGDYSGVVQSAATSPVLHASRMAARINGKAVGDDNLTYLVSRSGIALNTITSIVILKADTFTTNDWQYMFDNWSSLSNLSEFIILDDVHLVMDMPGVMTGQTFYYPSLHKIEISNMFNIGNDALRYCTNLTTATFPDVMDIGDSAFANCINLTTVTFPSLHRIQQYAFFHCINLKNLTFSNTDTGEINKDAFSECTSITDFTCNGLGKIAVEAFNGCTKLTSAAFPRVYYIDSDAFKNCTSLVTLKLPAIQPYVYNVSVFDGVPTTRSLVFIDESGNPLSGVALTTAQNAYRLVDDGNKIDNLWFGWLIAPAFPLSAVTINGITQIGQTLNATVEPSGATADYHWEAGGVPVGTNTATYEVRAEDLDKTITVTATGTNSYSGVVLSAATSIILPADSIKARINGTTVGGDSLSNLIIKSGKDLNTITSIEVLSGKVTTNDWKYMYNNAANLIQLSQFIVQDTVTTVADIPDNSNSDTIFFVSLQTVDIAKVKVIGLNAFQRCSNLTTATLPEVISIKAGAFVFCTNLNYIYVPKATLIGDSGFKNCTSLITAIFPKVTNIGDYAFSNCTSLTTLKLPEVPPTVYEHIFDGGASVKDLILVDANATQLSSDALTTAENAYKAVADGNTTDNLWFGWKFMPLIALTSASITGIVQVGQTLAATANPIGATMNYQWKVGGVEVGTNSATYEVQDADYKKTITVTVIGTGNYSGIILSTATSAALSPPPITARINGTSVGGTSFYDLIIKSGKAQNTITSIVVTRGVISLNDWASIHSLITTMSQLSEFIILDTVSYVVDLPGYSSGLHFDIETFQKIEIAKIRNIGISTFYGNTNLTTAIFPDVTYIGDSAFRLCSNLATATLPNLTSIETDAFCGCTSLTKISFPKATYVGSYAFGECTSITDVTLNGIERINPGTFEGCTKLTTAAFAKIEIICYDAFYNCKSLKTIKLPAVPPTVDTDTFKGLAADRNLVLIDASGNDLTGAALISAQKAYKAVIDGDSGSDKDNYWYGFYIDSNTEIIPVNFTQDQFFDVQRSAAFPLTGSMFRLSGMSTPYNQNLSHISWATGDYVKFEFDKTFSELDTTTKNKIYNSLKWYYNDLNTLNNAAVIKEVQYDSHGTMKAELSSIGLAWALDDKEGFLYTALNGAYEGLGGIGTFVSFLPHVYGSGTAYLAASADPLSVSQINAIKDLAPKAGSYVVAGQEKTFVISGILVDKKDNTTPIVDATISITTNHDGIVHTTTTDAGGNYAIEVTYKDTNKDYSLVVKTSAGTSPAINGTIDNTVGFGTEDNSITIPYIDRPIDTIAINPIAIEESPQWNTIVSAGGITLNTAPLVTPTNGSVNLTVSGYVAGNTYYRVLKDVPTAQFVGQTLQGNWEKLESNGAIIAATNGSFVEIVTLDNLRRIQGWGVSSTVVTGVLTYSVTGTIKDTNNSPISGAIVVLTDTTDHTKEFTAITNASGVYTITDVPNGNYTSTVTKNSANIGSGIATVIGSNVSGGSANIQVTPATSPPLVTSPPASATPETEEITIDVKIGNTEEVASVVTVQRTLEADGRKTDTVTYQKENAKETIEKLKEEGKDSARIVIPDVKDEISETNLKIPSATLALMAAGNINLEIDTEYAKISIPKESILNQDGVSKEELFFSLIPIKNEEEQAQIIARAKKESVVIELLKDNSLQVIGRPMTIETNMSSTAVDITLPLYDVVIPTNAKEREEFLSKLAVYIEHSDGEKVLVRGQIVDYKEGVLGIRFGITKFSTFTIIKADSLVRKSDNCKITAITSPASISPAVTIKGTNLSLTVKNSLAKAKIKVTVSEMATWRLYTDAACKREVSGKSIKLEVGKNVAYIKVTAEDGTSTKVYKLTLTRSKSNLCNIIKLTDPIAATIKGMSMTMTVNNPTTEVKVNVTVSKNATWRLYSDLACKKLISGNSMELNVGKNKAYIKVTAQDGTSKVFTVTIIRKNAVIFIATNQDFSDAYAGEVLAKQLGGTVVCFGYSAVEVQKTVDYITKNMSKEDTIYIFGLRRALKMDIEVILKEKGYKHILRIGGEDKYETAQKIAEKLNPAKGTRVVLINGENEPSTATKNELYAEKGDPILYVKVDSLTKYTIEALKEIQPTEIYLVGDNTQISDKVVKELKKEMGIKSVNIIRIISSK